MGWAYGSNTIDMSIILPKLCTLHSKMPSQICSFIFFKENIHKSFEHLINILATFGAGPISFF
jgi:hypothetical protein